MMTDRVVAHPAARAPQTVVVLGGTGFVGSALCRQLASHGHWQVVVVTRDRKRAESLAGLSHVVIEEADVFDVDALGKLLDQASAVVNLVAILHGDTQQFHRVHIKLPEQLARECRQRGHVRLVHVSALGVDSPGDSAYLQSKAWGEHLMRETWPDTTVLRPSVIFGTGDRFINTFARLQRFTPFVPLAFSEALFQPVWVEDVARALVACLDDPSTLGKVFECAGPTVLTLRELVRRSGEWAGVRRPIFRLPTPLAYAQAWLLEHLPGEPLMSRDNLRSMETPNIASTRLPSLHDLGITPRSLDDYLARS